MATPQGTIEECNRCGADIVWIGTFKGKRMPVDAASYEAGDDIYERDKHTAHFDTCGDKKDHSGRPAKSPQGVKMTPPVEKAFLKCMVSMSNGRDHHEDAKELISVMAENYVPEQSKKQEDAFDDDIPF